MRTRVRAAALFLSISLIPPLQAVIEEDSLTLWYTFEEVVNGTTIEDQSDNQLDAEIFGDPVLVDAKFGKAMEFDGDLDKLRVLHTSMLDLPEYTVSIWMNSQKGNDGYVGVLGRGGRHMAFWMANGNTDTWQIHNRFRDGGNGNDGPPNAGALTHDTWNLITLTKDMEQCVSYANGVFLASATVDHPYFINRTNLYIGANPDDGNRQYYVGQLDDVRLYNKALSAKNVEFLYNDGKGDWNEVPTITLNGDALIHVDKGNAFTDPGATANDAEDGSLTPEVKITPPQALGKPPVAWWTFDDTANDSTDNANNGSLVGDAAFEDGKFEKALSMDGAGDRAEVPAIKGFTGNATLSISAWINLNTLGSDNAGDGSIFTTAANTDTLFWVNFDADLNNGPESSSITMAAPTTGGTDRVNAPGGLLNVGEWHHVVGIMDGADRKVYIDGELRATVSTGATTHATDGKDVWIGGWSGTGEFDFDGMIDDVRVYDYAISDEKITKLHTWDGSEDLELSNPDIDTNILGDWIITYTIQDSHGYTVSTERTLRVQDPLAPVIKLVGEADVQVDIGGTYTEEGATAEDSNGTEIADADIILSGDTVDTSSPGIYNIHYDFTDANDRAAWTVTRSVTVADLSPPEISIVGNETVKHPVGRPYVDLGATASDTIDGVIVPLSSLYEWNQLLIKGFIGRDDAGLDFNDNGGYLQQTSEGQAMWDDLIYITSDSHIHDANAGIPASQVDNYHVLFEGVFRAPVEGRYRFGMEWPNERGSFFLDADQDGVFETDGANGTEWMNQGLRYGYSYSDLKPGIYKIAIGMSEGGGNPGLRPRVQTPITANPNVLVEIEPGNPVQENLWAIEKPIDTSIPGTHTITYTAIDKAGNIATATRTVVVEEITDPPFITLVGRPIVKHPLGEDYVDAGVTLADAQGNALPQEEVDKVMILGAVDKDTTGEYALHYHYTDTEGRPAEPISRTVFVVDLAPPTIELVGEPSIEHVAGQVFVDPGLTVTDNIDPAPIWGSTANIPTANLFLHIDASSIPGVQDGDIINEWLDLSPGKHNLTDTRGDPQWIAKAINMEPAVYFDGNDYMAAVDEVQRQYSIYTVSRLEGTQNARLISSLNSNWFMGYWGNSEDLFHPEAFATGTLITATSDPHIYSAISTGNNHVNFYADGIDVTNNNARNGRILKLQLGGYRTANEPSKGYVSEILLYDIDHTQAERLSIETYLASKYHFWGVPEYPRPLLDVPGEYTILYSAIDAAGNRAFATRTLVVTPDPTLPIIQLNDAAEYHQEAGQPFTDPGATLVDVDGNTVDGDIVVGGDVVDINTLGTYFITYNHKTADDRDAIQVIREVVVADTTGPVITLNGDSVIQITPGTDFTDPGVESVDFEGIKPVNLMHDIPVIDWVPGLAQGNINQFNDLTTPNPKDKGIDPLGPTMAEIRSAAEPWGPNLTIVYSGQIYDEDGDISLMGNIDDRFGIFINEQQVLAGGGWGGSASKQLTLGAGDQGWHDVEIRISNGGGPGGLAAGNIPGIGVDATGTHPDDTDIGNSPDRALFKVAQNTDKFTMDLFRVKGPNYDLFDTSNPGTYIITYSSEDSKGHVSTKERTLIIREDISQPLIVLYGDVNVTLDAHPTDTYTDPKAKAITADGQTVLLDNIEADTTVDLSKPGIYTLTYDYEDAQGNFIQPAIRTVTVVDNDPPAITLTGSEFLTIHTGTDFQDPGFAATDGIDGSITAYSSLETVPGHLQHRVYLEPIPDPSFLDMEDKAISLFFKKPVDITYLGHGPKGEGLFFTDDNDFRKHPSINQWDHFQSFFYGTFHAPKDGEYTFRSEFADDGTATWIDRDLDGELSQNGLLGTERITWQNSSSTILLTKGDYPIYFGHRESTGSSSLKFMITLPGGVEETVHPARQSNLWSTPALPAPDTSKPGLHKIHYFAKDSSGNWAYAERTVSVIENPNRPVITMLGEPELTIEAGTTYKDAGVLLETALGAPIEDDPVITNLPDGNVVGEFEVTYNYTDAQGNKAVPAIRLVHVVDTIAPVIHLAGANPANHSVNTDYSDPGASVDDAGSTNLPYLTSNQFPSDGLVLHLDASFFSATLNDGDTITSAWQDQSGMQHHADIVKGDPTWIAAGPEHGLPTVHFDGDDMLTTTYNFEPDLDFYTILTVARYTTNTNRGRVISSNGRNWIFGFHNNGIRRWHSDGWLYNYGPVDAAFHVHHGDVNNLSEANFWVDNIQSTNHQKGLHPIRYMPRQITLGGWGTGSEMSKCDVSEILLYNRVLSQLESTALRLHLHNKYSVPGVDLQFLFTQMDTSTIGTQSLQYFSLDSTGNKTTTTRTINIVDPADLPVILLTGEAMIDHNSGTAYTDAGATVEGDADAQVMVNNPVNVDIPGTYTISYDYTDALNRSAITVTRKVRILDATPPVITLTGGETYEHTLGNEWADPGVTAIDNADGEVKVSDSILSLNHIIRRGYMIDSPNEALLDLDQNNGLLVMPHTGEARMDGLLAFYNDAEFMDADPKRPHDVGITREDNFQNLFLCYFHSKIDGARYKFGMNGPDDRCSIWIDLDQDGVFEREGDLGQEIVTISNYYGYREFTLNKGYYKFAITHLEWGGGSRTEPRIQAVVGPGPSTLTRIDTTDPLQDGLFVQYNPVDVFTPGEYQITYTATDSAGNTSEVVRTVTVRTNPDAPILKLAGESKIHLNYGDPYVEEGYSAKDIDGNVLDTSTVTVTGEINSRKLGLQHLYYNFSHNGIPARTLKRSILVADNAEPEITLNGEDSIEVLQGTQFVDPGATATDNYDDAIEVASSEFFPTDGLQLHLDASSIPALQNGDTLSEWLDRSGNSNHFIKTKGNPLYVEDGLNGQPAVYMDGTSLLTSTTSYSNKYTLVSVSQSDNLTWGRLISSQDQNFIYGYYNWWGRAQVVDAFHPNGWATNYDVYNTGSINLYTAISTGANYVSFLANGKNVVNWSQRNSSIGHLQFGGWQAGSEMGSGYIGEAILYDRVLNEKERQGIDARLTAKYRLEEAIPEYVNVPVNTQELGTYHVVYRVPDSRGNVAIAIRTVTVVPDPDAPVITLLGEATIEHEVGDAFTDPGHTLTEKGETLDPDLVTVTGTVDDNTPGTYQLLYTYKPYKKAHAADVTRYVVVRDTLAPSITLQGENVVRIKVGDAYVEPGFSATDQRDGDTLVVSNLNYKWNTLNVDGYLEAGRNDALLNYDNNGGLLALTSNDHAEFSGKISELTGDNAFRNLFVPRLTKWDDFQVNFHGIFYARTDGTYTFGVGNADDRSCFYIDLDQDGIFERNGDNGDEQMTTNSRNGFTTVTLSEGEYKVAIGFMEHTGNAWFTPAVTFPGNLLSLGVDTVDPQQAGTWAIPQAPIVDVNTVGTYTIEYTSTDMAGNEAKVTRTVHVVEDTSVPFIALKGEDEILHEFGAVFTDPGAKVTDGSGSELNGDLKSTDTVDVNVLGETILTYSFDAAESITRKVTVVDTTAPTITLEGDNPLTRTVGEALNDPGVTLTDLADSEPHFTSSQLHIPNQLDVYGFNVNPNHDSLIDFNNNGGVMAMEPAGHSIFTNGPNEEGMRFHVDNDFHRLFVGIADRDHYQVYFTGYFYARVDGDYTFEIADRDDRTSIWMDLDKDGIYSRNGLVRDELLVWNTQSSTVALAEGFYEIAIGFSEYTSGARMHAVFKTPPGGGAETLTTIQPGAYDQRGLWYSKGTGIIDTAKPGEHDVTYYAIDASGNHSSVDRKIIIEIDQTAPVLTLLGEETILHEAATVYDDPGVSIAQADGTPINEDPVESVTFEGTPVSAVDPTILGKYRILYNYTDENSKTAIPVERTVIVQDTTAPQINIEGNDTLTIIPGSLYEDAGATAMDTLDGDVEVTVTSSKPITAIVPGLLGGQFAGWNLFVANPGNLGVHSLGPEEAQNRSTAYPWNGNVTVMYTGEFYDEDGKFAFYEAIDEWARLVIDGVELFDDHDYNAEVSKSIDLGRGGWFSFELRMRNTGGSGGAKVLGAGLTFDPQGGENWIVPENADAETADLFRTEARLHNTIDTTSEGEFTITYTATDANGNTSSLVRTVIVKDDPTIPIIHLDGEESMTQEAGTPFTDPGYTVTDRRGEELRGDILITGAVDHAALGTYTLYYDYTSPGGTKTAPRVRRIVEVIDTTPPEITLNEGLHYRINIGDPWNDPGFTVSDNLDTNVTVVVSQGSNIPNMVAHWTFEDGAGDTLTDIINGIDGTLQQFDDNDAAWVDSQFGKAIQFDGVKNYIQIPQNDLLDVEEYSISAWVQSADFMQDGFIFENTTNINEQRLGIYLESTDLLRFRNIDDQGNFLDADTVIDGTFNNGEWHHIAVTNTGADQMLYVDGEVLAIETHDIIPNSPTPDGNSSIGSSSLVDYFFNGLIDEVRFLNKAVVSGDIPLLMEPGGINTTKKTAVPYIITYSSTDTSGNTTTVERKVYVSNDSTPPTLTLNGDAEITIPIGSTYTQDDDAGATATDETDPILVMQPRIEVSGIEDIDTSKAGTFTITYNVTDLFGNSATPVTRKIIVGEVQNTFASWVASTPLASLDAGLQAPEADPDLDGIKNLLEYALGTEPTVADTGKNLSTADTGTGHLIIKYVRRKDLDSTITIKAQLSTNLSAPTSWDENAVTETLDTDQSGLTAEFERIKVQANTAIASETQDLQFIRILVEKTN